MVLKHKGTIPVETQRLLLRRFSIEDAASTFHNWANDQDICKYMRWLQHKNIEETEMKIRKWIDSYDKLSFYQWAVTWKGNNEPIGSIGLFVVNKTTFAEMSHIASGKNFGDKALQQRH